jgi:hypothetical protein
MVTRLELTVEVQIATPVVQQEIAAMVFRMDKSFLWTVEEIHARIATPY